MLAGVLLVAKPRLGQPLSAAMQAPSLRVPQLVILIGKMHTTISANGLWHPSQLTKSIRECI